MKSAVIASAILMAQAQPLKKDVVLDAAREI